MSAPAGVREKKRTPARQSLVGKYIKKFKKGGKMIVTIIVGGLTVWAVAGVICSTWEQVLELLQK